MFAGKVIVLAVTGGIAAYKAAIIASTLTQAGAQVETIMTEAAQRFVQPLTFSALTHADVYTDSFSSWRSGSSGHVSLAKRADLMIVAPATASTLARMALGLSDDLVVLVALSTEAPLLIAPAMEDRMYRHPAVRQHLAVLEERGATFVGPEHGRLASGAQGQGRMASPESVVAAAGRILGAIGHLAGRKVVVTAGGTREPLDPVRFIGNRSSGRMGYAVAEAARAAGADVTLITGAVAIEAPPGVTIVRVETAQDMLAAVDAATRDADVLIMAAAVTDFRPEAVSTAKIKKTPGTDAIDVRLVRNPDILASIDRPRLVKIGFAAETENLVENAAQKLRAKGLAMIVANDAESTIGAEASSATILTDDGTTNRLPRMAKHALAAEIVERTAAILARRGHTAS